MVEACFCPLSSSVDASGSRGCDSKYMWIILTKNEIKPAAGTGPNEEKTRYDSLIRPTCYLPQCLYRDIFCLLVFPEGSAHISVAEAPRLQLDELFSPSMPLNGLSHYFSADPSTPNKQPPPSAAKPMRHIEHDTPTKQHPASRNASPLPPEVGYSLGSPQTISTIGTPTSESGPTPDSQNWSAAIGRAATGKSGRVIEKLMGENDRLQREKTLAIVKLDEEVKRGESARLALEGLQVSNETLSSIHESDKTQMTKKDRKIELLRADLQSEKLRREKAEKETRESRREREEVVEELRRVAAEDREEARRSTAQYEILASSWKTLEDRYERQTQRLKTDLNDVRREIDGDKRKMTELEVVIEQLTHELAKVAQAKEKLLTGFQAYKKEQEAGLHEIQEKAERNNSANKQLHDQLSDVLGQMKHVVNVKRDSRENV